MKKYDLGGYVKSGTMAEQLDRPMGGPILTTKSRFYKDPDTFRTSIQRQEYGPKKGPGGELSKTKGETKQISSKTDVEKPGEEEDE